MNHHPLYTGTFSMKAKGVWVRSTRTGVVGWISYTQRTGPLNPTPYQTVVWIVCPPNPAINPDLKTYAACTAFPSELRKLNWDKEE